ncbi:MAG: hypothetical protein LC131_07005 [Anaerolineae bacterium]|nr:hypothetical protein [Anaerolineae bacterium]
MLYALKSPDGNLIDQTVAQTSGDAWHLGYSYLFDLDKEFGRRYWHKWNAFKRAARRLGWKVVPVKIVEAKRPR